MKHPERVFVSMDSLNGADPESPDVDCSIGKPAFMGEWKEYLSLSEHEELLAEAVAAAKADGARELANFIEDQCYTSGTFGENEMWRKVHEMETSRAKPEQGGGG